MCRFAHIEAMIGSNADLATQGSKKEDYRLQDREGKSRLMTLPALSTHTGMEYVD